MLLMELPYPHLEIQSSVSIVDMILKMLFIMPSCRGLYQNEPALHCSQEFM